MVQKKTVQNFEHVTTSCLSLQADFSEEDLTRAMSGMGLEEGGFPPGMFPPGGVGGIPGDPRIMPAMQLMMRSLLSKDVLYPSLKEISTKVRGCDRARACVFERQRERQTDRQTEKGQDRLTLTD